MIVGEPAKQVEYRLYGEICAIEGVQTTGHSADERNNTISIYPKKGADIEKVRRQVKELISREAPKFHGEVLMGRPLR